MHSSARPRSWFAPTDDLARQLRREQAKVQARDQNIAAWKEENEALRRRVSRYRKEARASRRAVEELQTELDEERAAMTILRRDFEAQAQLLQTRGEELREAQAYSATVDTVSHNDVVRVLDALNAEIFQFAAQAADGVLFHNVEPPGDILAATEKAIGRGMVKVLTAVARGRCEPIGVQIALQAVIARVASWAVSSWARDTERDTNLREIYDEIFANESRGVSAKWKALTRRHSTRNRIQQEELREEFLHAAACVLQVAGVRVEAIPEPLAGSLRSKAAEIARLNVQMRAHIGEDIASSDFRVIVPRAGEEFNSERMADENASAGKSARGFVLCATGLGLYRREQTRKAEGGPGDVSETVVKKASIMMTDELEYLTRRRR